nr:uncharacterized protein LOC104650241 [Saimiri boliviensis boliviensis]
MVLLPNPFRGTEKRNHNGQPARPEGRRGAGAEGLGLWRHLGPPRAGCLAFLWVHSGRGIRAVRPLRHMGFPSLGVIPLISPRRQCWAFHSAPGCWPRAESQPGEAGRSQDSPAGRGLLPAGRHRRLPASPLGFSKKASTFQERRLKSAAHPLTPSAPVRRQHFSELGISHYWHRFDGGKTCETPSTEYRTWLSTRSGCSGSRPLSNRFCGDAVYVEMCPVYNSIFCSKRMEVHSHHRNPLLES